MVAFWDTIRLAFAALAANKMRSALTLLGIVIAVTTVVGMMALIEGLRARVDQQLSGLGADVFQVQKWPHGGNHKDWKLYAARKNLTVADAAALRDLPSVVQVGSEAWEGGQKVTSRAGSTGANQVVVGATPEFVENNGLNLAHGRFLTVDDVAGERPVAVVGYDLIDALFAGLEPLGQEIVLRGSVYRVVGIFTRQGAGLFGGSQDNLVAVPISAFFRHYGKERSVNITVKVREPRLMAAAQDEVVAALRRRRNVAPTAENDFDMFNNETAAESFNQLSGTVSAATAGVCLLSLLVGGIGVLNIMLVSVSERTVEIGIRKALGARRRRILMQFTVEAVVLTLLGGVLGVVLGGAISVGAREIFGIPTSVPAWAVILGLSMSTLTGLLFGIYPAARAARLDPATAMRAG
jgi:putative ABC transport system permease protein